MKKPKGVYRFETEAPLPELAVRRALEQAERKAVRRILEGAITWNERRGAWETG